MGLIMNPGNEMFRDTIRSEIYIDKSMLIDVTNRYIGTRQKYMCVSRPRRFGKSVAAEMLCSYYGRGCDSIDVFAPLLIAKTPDFEKHLNQYNVLHVNMVDFFGGGLSVEESIGRLSGVICSELREAYPNLEYKQDDGLQFVLAEVYERTNVKFVFILDEWDCVFRLKKANEDAQRMYLDFLRTILKDKPYVALAYMTGILPVKKYGEHSALNMFDEYSMINAVPLSEFTGFTEDEVKGLCERYQVSFEEISHWYNGYQVDGMAVYNPQSVVSAMLRKRFDNYWNSTETFEALKMYINMNMDGIRDKIVRLISGETIFINTEKFQNDMTTLGSGDDVFTLLIHLGYLTYDSDSRTVRIPNYEVMKEFINSIEDGGWENVAGAVRESYRLLKATLDRDAVKVAESLERVHGDTVSLLQYNDENSLSCVIALAYYAARKDFVMHRELPAGKEYADVVFVPRRGKDMPAIIVELKYDASIEAAISQIHERNYMECLKDYQGEMLLVGINYDKKSKKHSCMIEQYVK